MPRLYPLPLCAALVLVCAVPAPAQVKDAFIQGVADFANAVNGLSGDEGPALTAAIDAMARGLALWDAAVAKVEAGLASEIGGAPPPVAARMRATLGAVYLERGRLDAALEQFDEAFRLDPQVRDVQLLRGLVYERMNQPGKAVAAFRAAWQQETGNVTTAYLLLRVASTNADLDEKSAAMKTLSEAVETATPVNLNRPQFMVLDLIDEASVPAPVFVPAIYNDAAALLMQAKYDEAIALLRKDAAHTSLVAVRDERARLAAADARGESGDPAGARVALDDAIRAFPKSGMSHWKLGRLQLALGDEAGALRSFEMAATLPSLGGAAHLFAAIGRIRHNRLDLDGAVSAYMRQVELTLNDPGAHVDLGDVYRAEDRLDEALAEYSIASLLDPTNVKALASTAQVHSSAGRDDVAVKLLRRAVSLDPAHLEARYALSRALLRLGLTEDARRELQVFEQLQQKAMQDERRRFQENQIRIDETLKAGERQEPGR
jgi:tetratricopeptide (TPR) repeat protein